MSRTRILKGWQHARPNLRQLCSYTGLTPAELLGQGGDELDRAVFRMSKRGRPPADEQRQAVPARRLHEAIEAGRHQSRPVVKAFLRGGRTAWARVQVSDNLVDLVTEDGQIVWSHRWAAEEEARNPPPDPFR